MKVLVCGGRDYTDRAMVFAVLDGTHYDKVDREGPITRIISGACADLKWPSKMRGADAFAIEWAIINEIDFDGRPARWRLDGHPQAGPMRNQRMLDEAKPDLVIAFPGGTGTADMVRRAKKAGVPVREIPR